MRIREVAFLGPEGTYSHLVAQKRFRGSARAVPLPTIMDVCEYVADNPQRRGIVPIENSSGGAIYETVDIMMNGEPSVCILEEITLNVKLALLGRPGAEIKILYSHFAPLEHCAKWLKKNLPQVEKQIEASTAVSAQRAAAEQNAAALGSRRLSKMMGLKVLHYPVEADIPNITAFLCIGGKRTIQPNANKTTLTAILPNEPGSLYKFLGAFENQGVNLSRLISRPLRGIPWEYGFLVDIEGAAGNPNVKRAITAARKTCTELRIVGAYPSGRHYNS